MSTAPATLDVSRLPGSARDARSPVWWGNTLLMAIETTTFALLLVSYFYLWQNYEQWPPPRVDALPPIENPVPDLGAATVNTLLLLAGCLLMYAVESAARRQGTVGSRLGLAALVLLGVDRWKATPYQRTFAVGAGLVLLTALALVAVGLRAVEFSVLKFRWDDNAYASVVWSILGMHLMYILVAAAETGVLGAWVLWYGLDENQTLDVTLTAAYWYWTVGVWLAGYAVVYWAPRLV